MNSEKPKGEFIDYYKLLEADTSTGPQTLRINYIRLAKAAHPDAGGSTERMQLLNKAYRTLTNSLSRAAYDKMYEMHTGVSPSAQFEDDGARGSSETMSDDYIDYFLDKTFAEYHQQKDTAGIKAKIKRFFSEDGKI